MDDLKFVIFLGGFFIGLLSYWIAYNPELVKDLFDYEKEKSYFDLFCLWILVNGKLEHDLGNVGVL